MAAVIPEAAEAVTEGTTAVRGSAAARRSAARSPRPKAPPRSSTFSDEAVRQRRAARSAAPSRGPARTASPLAPPSRDRQPRRRVRFPDPRVPGNRQYQPAILAEFLVAILITAVAPIAQGGDKTAQAKGGPSPYSGDTLKQLVAIGAAYFLLAILSGSRKYGRAAAWFGGLILLAVGLNSFVTGGLIAIFGIFGPSPQTAPPDASGADLQQTVQQAEQGFNAAASAAQDVGNRAALGAAASAAQNVTRSDVTFTQPGVATTTESSPGVSVT